EIVERVHRVTETAGKVIDGSLFARFRTRGLKDKGSLGAAGEGVPDPFSAVADGSAVNGFCQRHRIDVPGAARVGGSGNGDVDGLLLVLVVVPPEIEPEDLVVRVVKELRIDPLIERALRDAGQVLALLVENVKTRVRAVKDVATPDGDLGIDLSVAVVGSV